MVVVIWGEIGTGVVHKNRFRVKYGKRCLLRDVVFARRVKTRLWMRRSMCMGYASHPISNKLWLTNNAHVSILS